MPYNQGKWYGYSNQKKGWGHNKGYGHADAPDENEDQDSWKKGGKARNDDWGSWKMLHQSLIIQAWIQKLILGGKGMSFLIAKEVDSAQMMMHGKTCGRTDAFQFPHNQRTLNHLVTAAFLTSQFVLLLAVLVRLQKLLLD
jgi:hypothetical protein